MNAPHRLVVAAVLAAAALSRANAAEWPRFRGPDGAGISDAKTIPVQWTEKDYNWKVELPGSGHSSPVLWGRRVFLTCADAKSAARIVCALDADSGQRLWTREFPSKPYRQHQFNSYASASPAADAERVYVAWTTPDEVTLLAFSHEGKTAWRRTLGTFAAMHGSGSSPVVFGSLVVLAIDQKGSQAAIVAVDRRTGETRWTVPRNNRLAAYGTPTVYRPAAGPPQLLFTSSSQGITSVDPATGKVVWEVRGVFPHRCASSPVVAGGVVFGTAGIGGRGRSSAAVRPASPDGAAPAKVAWKLEGNIPYVPTAVAHGDLLFVWTDQGVVMCLRAATGEQVWQQKVGANFFGSPVRVGDRLYCISMKGDVFVLAASDTYKLLARNRLGERSYATPAVAHGRLYLRTCTHLISVGGARPR
ncbi:PQQ-binding-like beta-propeller repeat protein [bacterium]|nr:PQQ-binding-like beta-propeller repeat protein [bacterium]